MRRGAVHGIFYFKPSELSQDSLLQTLRPLPHVCKKEHVVWLLGKQNLVQCTSYICKPKSDVKLNAIDMLIDFFNFFTLFPHALDI